MISAGKMAAGSRGAPRRARPATVKVAQEAHGPVLERAAIRAVGLIDTPALIGRRSSPFAGSVDIARPTTSRNTSSSVGRRSVSSRTLTRSDSASREAISGTAAGPSRTTRRSSPSEMIDLLDLGHVTQG